MKSSEEKKCNCGPDCTCGCQEGKECTCDDCCDCGCGSCDCDCDCDCGCDCGCDCDCNCDCDCCSGDYDDYTVEVGDAVPNFELEAWLPEDGDFGAISLDKFLAEGKWVVLVFFPAAFSDVCPTELAAIAEKYEAIMKLGAEVVCISEDTKYVLRAWANQDPLLEKVKYPMASDVKGDVARLFGAYDVETGLALRGTYIISPEGKLVSCEVSYYNVARSAEELYRKLAANIFVSENPGATCPAKWQPKQ